MIIYYFQSTFNMKHNRLYRKKDTLDVVGGIHSHKITLYTNRSAMCARTNCTFADYMLLMVYIVDDDGDGGVDRRGHTATDAATLYNI